MKFCRHIVITLFICCTILNGFSQVSESELKSQLIAICENFKSRKILNNAHLIKSIFEDRDGFIWMGLVHRLIRYDGRDFIEFYYHPEEHPGMLMSGPEIIEQDQDGNIWIGSYTSGVSVLMKDSSRFHHFKNYAENLEDPDNLYLSDLFIDKSNQVWVSTPDMNLHQYNRSSSSFTQFQCSLPPSLSRYENTKFHFGQIAEDKLDVNRLWIGSRFGLFSFDKKTGQFRYVGIDKMVKPHSRPGSSPLFMDDIGQLWFGHFNGEGLKVFDTKNEKWTHRITSPDEFERTAGASRIVSISPMQDSLVIASTAWNHLIIASRSDPSKNAISAYTDRIEESYGFLVDAGNQIWIGKHNELLVADNTVDPFAYFSLSKFLPIRNKSNFQTAFYFDEVERKYYIGTSGGDGIFELDEQLTDGKIHRFLSSEKTTKADIRISDFIRAGHELWFAGSNGLMRFNMKTKKFEPHFNGHRNSQVLNRFLLGIDQNPDGLWITFRNGGICKFDKTEDEIELLPEADSLVILTDFVIYEVIQKGDLLFMATVQGFHIYDITNGRLLDGWTNESDEDKLEEFTVHDIVQQEDTIWIASKGNGLCQLTIDGSGSIQTEFHWSKRNFGTNIMNKILLSQNGQIWLATNYGISVFDPRLRNFKNYGIDDGLSFSNRGGWLEEFEDGRIGIGANRGFEYFYPRELMDLSLPVKPYLKRGPGHQEEQNLFPLHPLAFNVSNDEPVVFEMGSINFNRNPKSIFRYRLTGYNDNWSTTSHPTVTYYKLPVGSYDFEFSAGSKDGAYSPEIVSKKIEVKSPFFKSRLFYLLSALFMLLLAALILLYYRKSNKEKNLLQAKEAELLFLQKERAEAELTALRAQMNPHFLFNSLNSINWYIVKKKTKEASKYLTRFSKLVRLILEYSKSNFISLEEELECLQLYINLEGMRFEESFNYALSIDPELTSSQIEVPPLIIQPFVENAIWHGLLRKKGEKTLSIHILTEQEQLKVVVQDNGIGREAAFQKNGRESFEEKGINITRNRIRKLSRSEIQYDIKIIDLYDSQSSPTGTRVELLLPLRYK